MERKNPEKQLTKTEIPTNLKNNAPSVKLPLIFWFLIMTFN